MDNTDLSFSSKYLSEGAKLRIDWNRFRGELGDSGVTPSRAEMKRARRGTCVRGDCMFEELAAKNGNVCMGQVIFYVLCPRLSADLIQDNDIALFQWQSH